jgi:hypothetical protein
MSRKLIILAASCVLVSAAFVTLPPIGLRPETGSVGIERFFAYGLLGTLFIIAYPQHFVHVIR